MAASNIRPAGFPGIARLRLQLGDSPACAPAQLPGVPAWVARYASTNVRPWVKRKERKEWKRKDWTAKSSSDTIFQCRCNCNSASLDFEQQLLRKFRKLNLSIVKVRAKLVHVIFHYFVICKTASHYNISLLQSEHIFRPVQYSLFRNTIGNPFNFNVSILQYCKFNVSEQSQCNCVVTSSVSQYFNIASYLIFRYFTVAK